MAHYDCASCGDSDGIGYGSCRACTPPEVFKLKYELQDARYKAEENFKKDFAEQIRAIEMARNDYVNNAIKDLKKKYEEAYEQGRRKNG